ncbi:MAG: hypothetical protein J6P28_03115 [Treponema sp.]|nr:hypothetical protein [Treponema sp.]
MTEEQKEKYANFLDKISEILGLNKPVDILRLCAVTDEYLRPIEKHIAELEAYNEKLLNSDIEKHNKIVSLGMENAELKETVTKMNNVITETFSNLTQAKELLKKIEKIVYSGENEIKRLSKIVDILAEAEQFLSEVEK